MSVCTLCNGTGKVFVRNSDEIADDTGEPLEKWESCKNCGGSGILKETHSVADKRYQLLVFFIWCLNTLFVLGAFIIWDVLVLGGTTGGFSMDELPSNVQIILSISLCGVPISIILYLILSVAALNFIRRDKARKALLLVLVSMGVILLSVLPWIVYSALNPGLRHSLSF